MQSVAKQSAHPGGQSLLHNTKDGWDMMTRFIERSDSKDGAAQIHRHRNAANSAPGMAELATGAEGGADGGGGDARGGFETCNAG